MASPADSVNGRHCAYCLKFLPSGTAKRCAKCSRRTYCSRECQTLDWKATPGSQVHKNWCGLGCGEEDLDWEVAAVPGKGLGIIAKRQLPMHYRIMVDAARNHDHPGVMDLMPENGTRQDKISLNQSEYYTSFGDTSRVLCLRVTRVNHSCDPNAHAYNDVKKGITILYTEREIQAGEEITTSYFQMNDVAKEFPIDHPQRPSEIRRRFLKEKWGITCPLDCRCRDQHLMQLIQKCSDLYTKCTDSYDYTRMKEQLPPMFDEIRVTSFTKVGLLYDCFHMAVGRRSTLGEAKPFAQQAYAIMSSILHPDSEEVKNYSNWSRNPQTYFGYLSLEKQGRSERK